MRNISIATLVSFALVSLLWSPLPVSAQTAEANAPALTAMDCIEIQQLVNKLNFALDYCTNGGRDFADLFAADGEFIIDEGNGAPRVMNTREELIRLAGGPGCESRTTPPSSYILHLAESLVIERSPGGARGKSYAIYPSSKGKRFSEDVAGQLGIYHDEYVRAPNGWRLKSRRHETSPAPG
jgi:hypothetical protein